MVGRAQRGNAGLEGCFLVRGGEEKKDGVHRCRKFLSS